MISAQVPSKWRSPPRHRKQARTPNPWVTVRFLLLAFLIEGVAVLGFCPNSEIQDYACLNLAGDSIQPIPVHIILTKTVGQFDSYYFVRIQIHISRLYIWRRAKTKMPSEILNIGKWKPDCLWTSYQNMWSDGPYRYFLPETRGPYS